MKKIQKIQSHIKGDDYFGTLATVIDLMRQDIKKSKQVKPKIIRLLKDITDELVYLQGNYKITKK